MTKPQAISQFKENFLPLIDKTDKPAIRMEWNNFVDSLQKDRQITEQQARTWTQLAFCK